VWQQCIPRITKMLGWGLRGTCALADATVIHREWLPRLAPQLCEFSKPLEQPAPHYDSEVTRGRQKNGDGRFVPSHGADPAAPTRALLLLHPA
jgi:hypothetical protein